MVSRLKIGAVAVMLAFGLSGCAEVVAQYKKDLAEIERRNATAYSGNAQTSGMAMAVQPATGQRKPTQLIVPNDKRISAAIDEAMPNIKKVLGIHQCLKDWPSLRMMNIYAVPGIDMSNAGYFGNRFPNGMMKYHDQNKCVSVSVLDQWTMPANNALQFRTVYFAEDSGETVNFQFLFKKMDDDSWKVAQLTHSN